MTTPKKSQINVWQIYFFLFAFIMVKMQLSFVSQEPDFKIFYKTLLAFDQRFTFHYIAHHIFLILNLISLFFLARFAWDKRLKHLIFCQLFLLIKIFFDITGNLYFVNQLETIFKQSHLYFAQYLLTTLGLFLPGYLGLYFLGVGKTQKDI